MKVTTGAGIVAGSCNFNKAGEGTRKKKRKQVVKKTRKNKLPEPKTCSPLRWIFTGKTGSPPVATFTLSPLDDVFRMWRAAWQN